MREQFELFPKPKNYWTGVELRDIQIAENQLELLRDRIKQGKPIANIAKITAKDIIPALKSYAEQNLSDEKKEFIIKLITNLETAIQS